MASGAGEAFGFLSKESQIIQDFEEQGPGVGVQPLIPTLGRQGQVEGQPSVHSELQDSQRYTVRPSL